MEPGGFGFLAKAGAFVGKKWLQFVHRTGDRLEAENAELRKDLIDLLHLLEKASTSAQAAVNSSSNDPATEASHAAAVGHATQACQRVANLFQVGPGNVLNQSFLSARLEFRETSTDEDNPSLMEKDARMRQCERIEAACANFHNELCEEAFRRYGQGIGTRSGILKGRKVRR